MRVVILKHDCYPSPLGGFLNKFRQYLTVRHNQNPESPADLQALERDHRIRVVITGGEDPHGMGLVNWRVALFYQRAEQGDDDLAIQILDDFLVWALQQGAQQGMADFEAHVIKEANIIINLEGLTHPRWVDGGNPAPLPLNIFSVAPPNPGRHPINLNFQTHEDNNVVDLVWSGLTHPFRTRFSAVDVALVNGGDEATPVWIRVLRNVDCSDGPQCDNVVDILTNAVLRNHVFRLIPDPAPTEGAARNLYDRVCALPHCHEVV